AYAGGAARRRGMRPRFTARGGDGVLRVRRIDVGDLRVIAVVAGQSAGSARAPGADVEGDLRTGFDVGADDQVRCVLPVAAQAREPVVEAVGFATATAAERDQVGFVDPAGQRERVR